MHLTCLSIVLSMTLSISSSGLVRRFEKVNANDSPMYPEQGENSTSFGPRFYDKRAKLSSQSVTRRVKHGDPVYRNIRSSTYQHDIHDPVPVYSSFEPFQVQNFDNSYNTDYLESFLEKEERAFKNSQSDVSNWTNVGELMVEHVPDQQRDFSAHDAYATLNHGNNYEHLYVNPGYLEGNHHPSHHIQSHTDFEVEDKVFSKTIVATKALNAGKVIFVFFMVLIVFVLSALAKLGLHLSPVVLPLALLPIGFIALILFIPLFFLFVPLVATGLAGERRRRSLPMSEFGVSMEHLQEIQERLSQVMYQIDKFQ